MNGNVWVSNRNLNCFRIYALSIKAQCKLLHIVFIHPILYRKLVTEYVEILEIIEKYHTKPEESIIIKQFLKETIQIEDTAVKPQHLTLDSNNITILTTNVLEVIKYIVTREIDLTIGPSIKIWETSLQLLNRNLWQPIFVNILEAIYLILEENLLLNIQKFTPNFIKFLTILNNRLEFNSNLTKTEIFKKILELFALSLNKLDNSIIVRHYYRIGCFVEDSKSFLYDLIFKFPFVANDNPEIKLAVEVQDMFSRIPIDSRNFELNFDYNLQMLKLYDNNLDLIVNYFDRLIEIIHSAGKSHNLNTSNLKIFNETVLEKFIPKFLTIVKLDSSLLTIQKVNKIIHLILILTKCSVEYKSNWFSKKLFVLQSYPFITKMISSPLSAELEAKLKRITITPDCETNSIKLVTSTAIHCSEFDKDYLGSLNTLLKTQQSGSNSIKSLILSQLPYLNAKGLLNLHSIIGSWFLPNLKSLDTNILLAIAENIRLLICVSAKQYKLITNTFDNISYQIVCKFCDKFDDTYLIDEKFWEEIDFPHENIKDASVVNLLGPFLRLLSVKDQDVLKKMMKLMVTISYHYPKMMTVQVVKEWILLVKHENIEVRKEFNQYFGMVLQNIQVSMQKTA